MGQERELNENTVIGVAKTRQDGKIVYLNILYGNRVVLPDGSTSQIEPAIYERILAAFLEKKEEKKETAAEPETRSTVPEKYFHTEDEFRLPPEKKREEKEGVLPEAQRPAPTAAGQAEEEKRAEGTEPLSAAQLAADEEEGFPLERLTEGRRKSDSRMIAILAGALLLLGILLVLSKLGIL